MVNYDINHITFSSITIDTELDEQIHHNISYIGTIEGFIPFGNVTMINHYLDKDDQSGKYYPDYPLLDHLYKLGYHLPIGEYKKDDQGNAFISYINLFSQSIKK